MLNVFTRRAASQAHAPFQGMPASQAHAAFHGLAALSIGLMLTAAHAAEPAPEQATPSPFKHYQTWRDEPLKDWRQANDRVGEIGGWRTYLRESQQGGEAADRGGHNPHGHHGH